LIFSGTGFNLRGLGLARSESLRRPVFRITGFSVASVFLFVLRVKPLHFEEQVKGLTQRTRRKEEAAENFIFRITDEKA
jgi:hypothetical protein